MTRSLNLAMRRHSIQPRTRKYVEEFGFSLFTRKYKKQLLGAGLNAVKLVSQKNSS